MAKYDPKKDYSTLLADPNLTPAQREQYTQERQAKIQDMYGGAEPTYGNTGATFSSQYGASGARPTTYFNVDNPQTQQTGYIINGATYSDPYGNNRVGTGSVVNTDAGRYIKTDTGSMRYDDYLTGLNQQLQQENQKLQTQQITMDDVRSMLDRYSSPAYTPSPWDETREKLAQAALAMNYDDWTNSDQYRALANRYGHQGQLTMQDVLGQVASRTGGLASSWAQTAAQQQYNEYMARLEEAARSAYNTERGNAIENAQLAYDFADNDYGRYLDQLAQSNNDRSFAFDVLSRALEQSNYNNEWANTLERQRIADARYDDETAYSREQAAAAASAYSPTFTQAQVITAHNNAVKNGTQLEGNMLRDYNYYMYGDPNYSGSGTTQQTTATTTPSGTTKTTTTASTSNYNGTLTKTQVKKLQEVLGVAQDGSFGPKTQAAALKKWGTTSPKQAWQQYTYSTQSGYGGTDIANQTAMQLWELKNDQRGGASVEALANKIEAWLNNGTLTEAQAEYLLDYFGY